MKSFKIKIAALVLASGIAGFTGCKKFLDVNENPNAPSDADVKLLLPSAQAAIAHALGNPLQIHGGMWSQYWTQSSSASQYRSLDRYQVTAGSFDRPWRMLYSDALQDLKIVIQKGEAAEQFRQFAAIAYILKGYDFQLLTDAFGDVPVKEALNVDITNPHYDSQELVYDSILTFINKGLSMIDLETEAVPAEEDLVFHGDMEKWQQFANTLKLRVYMRISKKAEAKARAGVQALQTANAEFLTEDAKITYTTTGGNQNPLFAEILGLGRTQNLVASSTLVDNMKKNSDPRLNIFYDTLPGGQIVSVAQGAWDVPPPRVASPPSAVVGANGQDDQSGLAPVKLISAAESYFLQAEAVAKTWLNGNARQLFEQGITASFNAYGVESEAAAYIANAPDAKWPAGFALQQKAIITQKYYAMCGNQCFEAWTEKRRTGFPDFFKESLASVLPAGRYPARLLYPNTEVNQNLSFPGLKPVTDSVWWDAQ